MLKPCECEAAGWCERHAVIKTASEVISCKKDLQLRQYLDEGSSKLKESKFITTTDLVQDTLNLIKYIKNPSMIIGIARSGLIPASILATVLHTPLWSIDQKTGELFNLSGGARFDPLSIVSDGIIYIVDDSSWTGVALKNTRKYVQELFPNKEIKTVCIYKSSITQEVDICELAPQHHFFEWNINNAVFKTVHDLDGVLCRDFTIEEDSTDEFYIPTMETMLGTKCKPLKSPVNIITARLERYRPQTEKWLSEQGFTIGKLIMGPWETKCTDGEIIGEWKANMMLKHFPDTFVFIESSIVQARIIFKKTRRVVVCTDTNTVFAPDVDHKHLKSP